MRNLISFLWQSRGVINLITRAISITQRFSLTPRKLENLLASYINLLLKFNVTPTFPVTANIIKRYPQTIKKLQDKGAKFEVHGYVHIDYSRLNLEQQESHFKRAIKVFKKNKIAFTGFRAPYTRWNNDTMKALVNNGFLWDSSHTILWDIINEQEFKKNKLDAYKKVIKLYNPANARTQISTPRILDNKIIEIPLTLPEDEMVVDRLGIKDKGKIKEIVLNLMKKTYDRGELFGLQIHHERIPLYKLAAEELLHTIEKFNPPVWKATFEEIAKWWNEKDKFTAEIKELKNQTYNIKLKCSARATVLIRNLTTNTEEKKWFGNYKRIKAISEFTINATAKPIIGINKNCSSAFIDFIKQEGYIFEFSEAKDKYSIYFDNILEFNELEILKQIENVDFPLIRFWRWPLGARSVLTITGDIDALTIFDFLARIFEST